MGTALQIRSSGTLCWWWLVCLLRAGDTGMLSAAMGCCSSCWLPALNPSLVTPPQLVSGCAAPPQLQTWPTNGRCCAVLCCAVLCCAVPRCAVLCCVVLCCAVILLFLKVLWDVLVYCKKLTIGHELGCMHISYSLPGCQLSYMQDVSVSCTVPWLANKLGVFYRHPVS